MVGDSLIPDWDLRISELALSSARRSRMEPKPAVAVWFSVKLGGLGGNLGDNPGRIAMSYALLQPNQADQVA